MEEEIAPGTREHGERGTPVGNELLGFEGLLGIVCVREPGGQCQKDK